MSPSSSKRKQIFSTLLMRICWALIGIWAIVWVVLVPQRGLANALDITNPSLLGVVAFSSGLFLLGHYRLLPVKLAVFSAIAVALFGFGLSTNRYLATKPITLEPGQPLVATFQIPVDFRLPVTALVIDPPVRYRDTDHFSVQLSCDERILGVRSSREERDIGGWKFGPFESALDNSDELASRATCKATVHYDMPVEFFRPTNDWIFVLSEQGELADFTIDGSPASIIDLDY